MNFSLLKFSKAQFKKKMLEWFKIAQSPLSFIVDDHNQLWWLPLDPLTRIHPLAESRMSVLHYLKRSVNTDPVKVQSLWKKGTKSEW